MFAWVTVDPLRFRKATVFAAQKAKGELNVLARRMVLEAFIRKIWRSWILFSGIWTEILPNPKHLLGSIYYTTGKQKIFGLWSHEILQLTYCRGQFLKKGLGQP